MKKVTTQIFFTILIALALPAALWAFPTALNLVPTADILGANTMRIAYESDGHNQPFDNPHTEYFYTQIGLGGKFEFGADDYDFRHIAYKVYNAKYLLTAENEITPAIAIGFKDVSDISKTNYYVAGYKTYGKARLHFGGETQDSKSWLFLGTDYVLAHGLYFIADWQTGKGRNASAGVAWEATKAICFSLYFTKNNTSSLRDTSDYVGGYVGYTFPLKQ